MRGKGTAAGDYKPGDRITPAYAGKSWMPFLQSVTRIGSPPPMRGKAHGSRVRPHRAGITPAYAGKREGAKCVKIDHKDHPRLCGEKCTIYPPLMTKIGSPPPMRGKVCGNCGKIRLWRITPAYAGKREWKRNCTSASWDHPRLCGEKKPKR